MCVTSAGRNTGANAALTAAASIADSASSSAASGAPAAESADNGDERGDDEAYGVEYDEDEKNEQGDGLDAIVSAAAANASSGGAESSARRASFPFRAAATPAPALLARATKLSASDATADAVDEAAVVFRRP